MHIIVTAFALVATVFGWSAMSNTEQPLASTDRTAAPAVAVTETPRAAIVTEEPRVALAETAPPVLTSPAPSAVPVETPALPQAKPTIAAPQQLSSTDDEDDDEDDEYVEPARAKPQAAVTPRRHARATRMVRARDAQVARSKLRGKGRAVVQRSTTRRDRVATRADGGYIDPFNCKARNNKPPCFR